MCGCNGTAAATSPAGVTLFTIQLRNGSKVGAFPTAELAQSALTRSYNGQGTVVPR